MYNHLESMEYYDLIQQWFIQSEKEINTFTRFIFLYISFTAFFSLQYNRALSDRKVIQKIKNDKKLRELFLDLVCHSPSLTQKLTAAILELKRQPIENTTRTSNMNIWDGKIQDETDWHSIVEFWYRVRNNLFHGHKALNFERDQCLVKFAFDLMSPLMKHFIDHNLDWAK